MVTLTEDTIIAISTPLGEGAIGVVRLSGAESLHVLERLFRPSSGQPVAELPPRRATHGRIVHPDTQGLIDEVVVTVYRAPRSYTGEDVVEISAHGSPVVLRRIVEAACQCGARVAEPGEFTKRAFLNGKLDLSQAEAVCDLIRARSDLSAAAAAEQLSGKLGQEIRAIQSDLTRLMAHLEASLDFADDELEPWGEDELHAVGRGVLDRVHRLIATYEHGRILREGITVAITGRPNVGKSSLLNALLRHERALVTPIPGTTRDTIEELTNIRGIPVKAIDTAGLRVTDDPVERLGVERARASIAAADLVLLVLDASEGVTPEDETLWNELAPREPIVVMNKCDIASCELGDASRKTEYVRVSALTGEGMGTLEDAIARRIFAGDVAPVGSEAMITRLRHKQALEQCAAAVERALDTMRQGLPADFVSIDVRDALLALAEITGENVTDEVINVIFSEFCIGK
ncbi:MAG: tRNA uridine-5-carboxymethylaminomethyl(34) synthesis GTPase MnmE [Abditibacteriales bacterium]|nr:tRNA uridine-5-carboxymethylaminomethyl(34) synthesis GTPase MnmE [Abditibacteriales bacterium]